MSSSDDDQPPLHRTHRILTSEASKTHPYSPASSSSTRRPRHSAIARPSPRSKSYRISSEMVDMESETFQSLQAPQTRRENDEDHSQSTHEPSTPDPHPPKRPFCPRCARPTRVCICSTLPPTPLPTATQILILQTAAESRAKVRTGDLIPKVLSNARLFTSMQQAAPYIPPDAILLFPGRDAVPLTQVTPPDTTLVALDATWDMAKRMYSRSQVLQSLQRAFVPERFLGPALFRARKPPVKSIQGARSTAEAVAGALVCVEGEGCREAVAALRRCVYEASEMQLRFVRERGGGGRHRRERAGYEEGLYEEREVEGGVVK